jgi:hypothetical protein
LSRIEEFKASCGSWQFDCSYSGDNATLYWKLSAISSQLSANPLLLGVWDELPWLMADS